MVDEIMDKFTKYALLTMTIIVLIMIVLTYVGTVVLSGGMEGTDATVNDAASTHTTSWFGFGFTADAFGQMGEYIGFSLAGVAGGFIVGYCFPKIFGKSNQTTSGREN
jgi:ABC-type cobalt transport system substrate-binding protein